MIAELLPRLDARFLFVVGKGGVGKTTTAGTLALAHADAGRATHLISTDPAHSLADLFEQALAAGPASSHCSPDLRLEEFDAAGYTRRWLARAAPAVAELLERGTYLDEEDARGFLDLTLPGIDEVMAALRLTELDEEPVARIVVDTAPTGHTLRLLEAGALIASWTEALHAMAEKVRAVAIALVRAPVPLAAEQTIAELERRVARFQDRVLRQSDFIVVTTPEPVVQAETTRLASALARMGLRVAGRVRNGGMAAPGEFALPQHPHPHGCAALRELARGPAAAHGPTGARGVAGSRRSAVSPRRRVTASPRRGQADGGAIGEWLRTSGHRLLLFAGKGGVGKSTCAAACAVFLSRHRRVTLFGTDPAGSLQDVLGVPLPAEGAHPSPGLLVRQIDAAAEFERLRGQYREDVRRIFARFGLEDAAVLDRRVVESLLGLAPPGLDEILAMIGMIDAQHISDTLVIDSAPTGHFLRLIEMPGLAHEWARALLRVFLKYRSALGLDETAQAVLRLTQQIRQLRLTLTAPTQTATFLVTLREPVVEAESGRLLDALGRAGIAVAWRLYNRLPSDSELPATPPGELAPGLLRAPEWPEPPVGPDHLVRFLSSWEPVT